MGTTIRLMAAMAVLVAAATVAEATEVIFADGNTIDVASARVVGNMVHTVLADGRTQAYDCAEVNLAASGLPTVYHTTKALTPIDPPSQVTVTASGSTGRGSDSRTTGTDVTQLPVTEQEHLARQQHQSGWHTVGGTGNQPAQQPKSSIIIVSHELRPASSGMEAFMPPMPVTQPTLPTETPRRFSGLAFGLGGLIVAFAVTFAIAGIAYRELNQHLRRRRRRSRNWSTADLEPVEGRVAQDRVAFMPRFGTGRREDDWAAARPVLDATPDRRGQMAGLARLVDQMSRGVALLDAERRIVFVNQAARRESPVLAAARVGEQLLTLDGQSLEEYLRPAGGPRFHDLQTFDEEPRHVKVFARTIEFEDTTVGTVILLHEEETECLRTNHLNRQARVAAARQLAASVAHDLLDASRSADQGIRRLLRVAS